MKSTYFFIVLISLLGLAACSNPTSRATAMNDKKAALVNVELGLGYLERGQMPRAKTKLIHAVQIAPKLPEAHSALAYFLEKAGEHSDAEVAHKRALALSHKGALYNNYGAFLCRRHRFQEADSAFQKALQDKQYARTAEVFENAGICALQANNKAKAFEYFTIAVRHDPNRIKAVLALRQLSDA